MAQVKISNLNPTNEVTSNDYFVIDNGSETRKIKAEKFVPPVYPFSFVGMVVQGTNLTTLADVQAIYGNNTTWQLISSVALASENIVGNGKALGLTDGSVQRAFASDGGSGFVGNNIGASVGTSASGGTGAGSKYYGIPTKAQLGAHPEYSGLIADTITVYMWERTA